jgi:NodT family efflux transporter outer membrane factor (OMF) lipoprotein
MGLTNHYMQPGVPASVCQSSLTETRSCAILGVGLRGLLWAISLGMLMAGQGCLMGEDYHRPSRPSVPMWDAMFEGEKNTTIKLDSLKEPDGDWWRLFGNDELDQLMDQALRQNHDVRRAAFRVMEARALMVSSRAGLFPQLTAVGSESNIQISKNTLAGLGLATQPGGATSQTFVSPGKHYKLYNTAMDLSWELDLWGRIRRGLEAATADAEALEHDRRGVVLTMLGDLGAVYFELRELDELIELAERTERTRRDSFEIITSRYRAGLATNLDVKRAEELMESIAAQIPEYRRLRAVALHHIEALIGSDPGVVNLPPKPLRAVVTQLIIPVGLPSQILERRPDILEAERNLASANAHIGEARAYFFPTLAITGAGGVQSVQLGNWLTNNSRTYNIGPSVTLPIFLGGTNVARLANAEARYQELLEQYQQTILNAFREVADLLVAVRTRADQRAHQLKQVKAAREARGLAEQRYLGGIADYLDVLDAEREILTAETALVQTEYARLNDLIMLFKALGGGWKPGNEPPGVSDR